jgi:dTDP-4-dehydrorhamnose 3,5-epimerase
MTFTETPLAGAFLIDLELREDERGFFARSFCQDEFRSRGLDARVAQCNISFSERKGTLRGMHFQVPPHEETKLVRCTMGEIFDVIVDVRPSSKSYGEWFAARLSARNRQMIYVPAGFAHGFQTMTDEAEVFYQMSDSHHPESARGIRWNDPALSVRWPLVEPIVSQRDMNFPDWKP